MGHPVLNEMYEIQDEIFEIQINENFQTNKKVQPIVYHENKSHQSVRLLRFSVPLSTKKKQGIGIEASIIFHSVMLKEKLRVSTLASSIGHF